MKALCFALCLLGAFGLASATPTTLRILFIGNSLVAVNDVPNMVKSLIESDGSGRRVVTKMIFAPHLNDVAGNQQTREEVGSGNWDYVVLQGAMVSMSHNYSYPQDGGILLAKMAVKAGSKTLLYSEWSRRGIDETAYTENVYKGIAKVSRATVIPIGRIWDEVARKDGGLDLLQPDGNHAAPGGSFLAAAAVYVWINGKHQGRPSWQQSGVDQSLAHLVLKTGREFWAKSQAPA